MERTTPHVEEEAHARLAIWKYIVGYAELAVVRCAVDLGIPDILEAHSAVTLADLSAALGCPPASVRRIMQLLTHHGIFKVAGETGNQNSEISYSPTALSRLLTKDNMAPMVLFVSSPEAHTARLGLSKALIAGGDVSSFEVMHGMDLWRYAAENASLRKMFDEAQACHARFTMSAVVEGCAAAFEGIGSLVDVGGGNGTMARALLKACPWIIRVVTFDLPQVVSPLEDDGQVAYVGGDMFQTIPAADAAFLMWVLHNWDDEACVKILKNCLKAIPKETGKVIIVESVVDDDDDNLSEGNKIYRDVHLAMDIEMMTATIKGKERTSKEWANLLTSAGFTRHTITNISAPRSLIVAYP